MTKAMFAERQDPVTVTQIEGVNYFQICLHEQEVQVQSGMGPEDDTTAVVTEYEYDFNEWHDATTDPEAVKADPEKYLAYVPVGKAPEQTTDTGSMLAQRVADIEDTLAAIVGGEA